MRTDYEPEPRMRAANCVLEFVTPRWHVADAHEQGLVVLQTTRFALVIVVEY